MIDSLDMTIAAAAVHGGSNLCGMINLVLNGHGVSQDVLRGEPSPPTGSSNGTASAMVAK